ncbi:MAG TPA: tetratricopeptide repeat protein [Candidatus Bathyarchaeia archaeon]|nr:tetratricopeptide repeat protein [Candidatus Bathyarchaeia archaeon]
MNDNRAIRTLSRRGSARGAVLVALLFAGWLAGCTSAQDEEVRKLQAKSSYDQAVRNLSDNRLALGMAALKESIQLDPDNARYHNTLGLVYLNLGRAVDGQAEIQIAIDLDKGNPDYQHNLGIALAQQGHFEDAIVAYKKALSFPTYTTPEVAYYNMGEAFIRLRKPQEAEEAFRAAIQLEPVMVAAHYGLGLALSQAGRKDDAKAAFRQARDLDPKSPFSELAKTALKQLGEGG